MSVSLDGASILVAGAGGIAEPLARQLAERGARITLAARTPHRLQQAAPPGAALVAADLRRPSASAEVVRRVLEARGRLDGVVFAAGVVAFGGATQTDEATFLELLEINLLAPVRLLKAAAPYLADSAKAGGPAVVVNVSAVTAEMPTANMAAYSASKAALTAYDAAAARELRRQGIRLIDARLPHTETGLAQRPISGEPPKLPEGKKPEEVAARIVAAIVDGERDLPSSAFD
ncbi:MAG: SDR family oxidoreductase [Kineosporiaceae bacterium]